MQVSRIVSKNQDSEDTFIGDLDDDIIVKIFQKLNNRDRNTAKLVCYVWNNIIQHEPSLITKKNKPLTLEFRGFKQTKKIGLYHEIGNKNHIRSVPPYIYNRYIDRYIDKSIIHKLR